MSDVSPLSGISGLSFDSTLLSPLLFFCLVLLPIPSYLFFCLLALSSQLFQENSSIFFVKIEIGFFLLLLVFFFFFLKALRTTVLLRGAQNRGDSGFLGSRRARGMSFVGEGPSVVLGKALSRYGG